MLLCGDEGAASGKNVEGKSPLRLRSEVWWCRETELNCRHMDFQSIALPLSYPGIFDVVTSLWRSVIPLLALRLACASGKF